LGPAHLNVQEGHDGRPLIGPLHGLDSNPLGQFEDGSSGILIMVEAGLDNASGKHATSALEGGIIVLNLRLTDFDPNRP
jgi:hypothetical protein